MSSWGSLLIASLIAGARVATIGPTVIDGGVAVLIDATVSDQGVYVVTLSDSGVYSVTLSDVSKT